MKAKSFWFAFLLSFLLFLLPGSCFAVNITITSFPTTITDESFNLTASISGATSGTNYLRVDFYKEGTSNYFGETYNKSDWYNGSDGKSYFPITIDSNKNGFDSLQAKIGNPNSTEYPGPGSYKMKIRRYTSSGSYSSNDNQSPVDITINYTPPTQTPTPTPTSTLTHTPTPTPTLKPTPSLTPKPTLKQTLTPTQKSLQKEENKASTAAVLGDNIKPTIIANKEDEILVASDRTFMPKIFISIGIVFILLCVIVIFYPILISKINERRNLQDKE